VGSAVGAVTSVRGGVGGGVGTDEGIVSGGGTGRKRESGRVRVAWEASEWEASEWEASEWEASDFHGWYPWLAG
jgi:hypothetical protein